MADTATLAPWFTLACGAGVAVLLALPEPAPPWARAVAKLGASTAFVAVAVALGAAGTPYGRCLLAALLCSWLGDALLLSRRGTVFLFGLGAFLLAHALFAAAFVGGGVHAGVAAAAVPLTLLAGVAVGRWLAPHLSPAFRWPVVAYVSVILLMCVCALAHSTASGRWIVAAGALLFAASDLAVARDRFVQAGPLNRLWGLPIYYLAQLLLAWSLATPTA